MMAMKDARYLLRLENTAAYQPRDQQSLLERVRAIIRPLGAQAINLRVAPRALEFDLFCSPDASATAFSLALAPLGRTLTVKRLDLPPVFLDAPAVIREAREFFREERFWEVHETLEGLWRRLAGSEKQLVQGLILAAAALVHVQKNEESVAWRMLEDAAGRLEGQPPTYYGIDIEAFRARLRRMILRREITSVCL